jgi:chemotaxis protein CheD
MAAERQSHFDSQAGATAIWIFAGDFYVTSRSDVFLTSVLGSCIAVCMRDPVVGCGGMNHFLLPEGEPLDERFPGLALRYGSYSIERLINAIVSRGGRRDRLEIKAFGGANVLHQSNAVGSRNVEFIEGYFAREGLQVAASDLRGNFARKLRYYPASGRAQIAEVRDSDATAAFLAERKAVNRLHDQPIAGDIEVF